MTDYNATAMPQKREDQVVQRARQLGQDVHPTDATQSSTRRPRQARTPFLHALRDDVMILLSGRRADITALLRARLADFHAHCRFKGAEVYALPLWKKFFFGIVFILWLLFVINIPYLLRLEVERKHCASEWILDTAAPYHTTNQLGAFAESKRYSSPVTYKGVESYGSGLVKLDLQYHKHIVKSNTSVTLESRYSYAPLELHFTQYVPTQANTISVSQLMNHNDGGLIPNKALLVVYEHRALGLRIDDKTNIMAGEIEGHYVLHARVPGRRTQCPDPKERSIYKVSETDYSSTTLAM